MGPLHAHKKPSISVFLLKNRVHATITCQGPDPSIIKSSSSGLCLQYFGGYIGFEIIMCRD